MLIVATCFLKTIQALAKFCAFTRKPKRWSRIHKKFGQSCESRHAMCSFCALLVTSTRFMAAASLFGRRMPQVGFKLLYQRALSYLHDLKHHFENKCLPPLYSALVAQACCSQEIVRANDPITSRGITCLGCIRGCCPAAIIAKDQPLHE